MTKLESVRLTRKFFFILHKLCSKNLNDFNQSQVHDNKFYRVIYRKKNG